MALNFGRSTSFPLTPARSFCKPRHVRSVSLPSTISSHPLLANLHAHITAVRAWIQDTAAADSSLPAGLAASPTSTRCTPRSPTSSSSQSPGPRFGAPPTTPPTASSMPSFSSPMPTRASRSASSRSGTPLPSPAPRSAEGTPADSHPPPGRSAEPRRTSPASVSTVSTKCSRLNLLAGAEEAEMAGALVEAAAVSAAASAAVFSSAASMSSPASICKKIAMFIPAYTTSKATAPETAEAAVERLHALEWCFDECDVCDMVFRSVVQTRVSLLSIMTPTI